MLAQNVARAGAARFAVQVVFAHRFQCGYAFHDLETVGRHQPRLGWRVIAVVGAPDTLDKTFDVFRCAYLDHQIHIAPVDPEIKAAGRDDGAQLARHHCRLHPQTLLAGKRSVVDANGQGVLVRQPQVMKEDLGLSAGVVEYQSGPVPAHLFEHARDRMAAAAAGPGGRLVDAQHVDIRRRARVGMNDFAGDPGAGRETAPAPADPRPWPKAPPGAAPVPSPAAAIARA